MFDILLRVALLLIILILAVALFRLFFHFWDRRSTRGQEDDPLRSPGRYLR